MREGALKSLRSPCHGPPQKLHMDCGALQDHPILYAFYLTYVCNLLVLCSYWVCLFVCLFVLEFYGPVNNEVMSSRSVNSGTVSGQA